MEEGFGPGVAEHVERDFGTRKTIVRVGEDAEKH